MKASTTKKARDLHRSGVSAFDSIPAGMGNVKRGKTLKRDSDTTVGIAQKNREKPMGIPS